MIIFVVCSVLGFILPDNISTTGIIALKTLLVINLMINAVINCYYISLKNVNKMGNVVLIIILLIILTLFLISYIVTPTIYFVLGFSIDLILICIPKNTAK